MRYWKIVLWLGVAVSCAAAERPNLDSTSHWERDGRSFFQECEFKRAAHAFERALLEQPENANLHYWLGKSYSRMAETSSPLNAPKNARKARHSLELAVRMEPRNGRYLMELFDFYVDSPEWFGGGLDRAAALLERVGPFDPEAEWRLKMIAESRKDHSGPEWWIRWGILRTSGAVGLVVPQP